MNATKNINNILKEAWNSDEDRANNPTYDTDVYPMCTRIHYRRLASECDRSNAHADEKA